jgi:hypothetical protein
MRPPRFAPWPQPAGTGGIASREILIFLSIPAFVLGVNQNFFGSERRRAKSGKSPLALCGIL